ncbi:Lycopene cyclase protein [uncultured archaeon]|nr:Lycopene cyclase protein [uncultured archaeon]
MEKNDIVIIGGGFAGASLAHKLSRLDSSLEITLIERNKLGGKPVSAFTFTDIVDNLGIRNSVKQYYNQIEITSTLGAKEIYAYDRDVFSLIDYKKACEELVGKSGCQVIFDEVKSIKAGKVSLGNEVIDAKIIVDASGRGYKFRKELKLDVPKIENHLYFKKLTHCNIPNPKSLHLIFGDIGTGGGWFYPINENECEAGVAERITKLAGNEKKDISNREKINLEQLLNYPAYSEMLEGSKSESEAMVYYPYEPVKHVVKGNVMFLGDTAGMVHPIFGMGIHYIDRIGTLCAEYCAKASHGNIALLREYQNAWDSMLKSDMNTWIWGMTYFDLNIKQINKIIEIRSNSDIDKMNMLSALRGHTGKNYEGDVLEVPLGLFLSLIKNVLKYKLKYKLKYRC